MRYYIYGIVLYIIISIYVDSQSATKYSICYRIKHYLPNTQGNIFVIILCKIVILIYM